MNDRGVFLLEMYKKAWDNINRHILTAWHSIGVLASAVAALLLTEKSILPLDYAATLVVITAGWQVAHALDSNFWFNRNLLIIGNIEREFLDSGDLRKVHYYFERHRGPGLLDHLWIQIGLGIGAGILVLIRHFLERVRPSFSQPFQNLDAIRALPYLALIIGLPLLIRIYRKQRRAYNTLKERSPGRPIATSLTANCPTVPESI